MAAKTFINTAGGTWNLGTNWSSTGQPGTADNAFINSPGTYSVTLDSTGQADTLLLNNADATLDITPAGVLLANTITLDAGTLELAGDIIGGTIVSSGGAFRPVSGTLDGVTWQGAFAGAGTVAGPIVNIKDGITLEGAGGVGPGTIEIGSLYQVNITDATTLDNLAIDFQAVNNEYLNGSNSLALNLGADVQITQTIADAFGSITGLRLNSLGTITAEGAASNLYIGSTTFDNEGALIISSGETVTSSSGFDNTGVVSVSADGKLILGSGVAPSNHTTISVASAATLIANADLGGDGEITLASHAVAQVDNVAGSIVFLDGKGTISLQSPVSFTGAIGGFQKGDTIDLPGHPVTNHSYSGDISGGTLTLMNSTTLVANLLLTGNYLDATFLTPPDGGTGTDVTVACFAAGTRILTGSGEVAVERLRVGDSVPTLSGGPVANVRWLGHRRIDCRRHPRPADVWPVRVQAGAFADGVPHRDLLLSPDHAVFVDAALIPVRHLVNGTTIAQVETDQVTYWHVELDRHAILLAEGLAAESFLDTGNRGVFENGGGAIQAHPDFAPSASALDIWSTRSCAPLALSAPALTAARARLLPRVEQLGFALTGDPDLRLVVDGDATRRITA